MPSLIISNVFTKMGEQTFTLRWEHGENINWCKIYDFIYKKSGVHPKYHKIQIERNYIKYEKINNYPAFNLNDFVYYDNNGKATQIGLLKTCLDEYALKHIRDNSGCIHKL
tara:strand:+ start:445 stop:777 length:333 start_codon:yes stop_codon:yes gene_type:complete